MVVTDLPFERLPVRLQRYHTVVNDAAIGSNSVVQHTSSAGKDRDEDVSHKKKAQTRAEEYASFLKEIEQKVGPSRFPTSPRIAFATPKPSETEPAQTRAARTEPPPNPQPPVKRIEKVIDVTIVGEEIKKKHEHQMKIIDGHMSDHKQQERELKRLEEDIKRNRSKITTMLRGCETAIRRKKFGEEKGMVQKLNKLNMLNNEFAHQRNQLARQRLQTDVTSDQALKDVDSHTINNMNKLALEFRAKEDAMRLREIELHRLMADFESKVSTNESKKHALRSELAEIALQINMEAQKAQTLRQEASVDRKKQDRARVEADLVEKSKLNGEVAQGVNIARAAFDAKRRLSASMMLKQAHFGHKKRETGKTLIETENKLRDTTADKAALAVKAEAAAAAVRAKQLEARIQETARRRQAQLAAQLAERSEREQRKEILETDKFFQRTVELKRSEHQDQLKHFQKQVEKDDDIEQKLAERVRRSQAAKLKHERELETLKAEMDAMKRANEAKLNNTARVLSAERRSLDQKIKRQAAILAKAHAQREESLVSLQQHRALVKEDRFQFGAHQREHERLLRIQTKTLDAVAVPPMTEYGANGDA